MLRCTIVIGSGRSGTSLTTGLLAKAGATVSEDLVKASIQNPTGSFEDRNIQRIQRDMLLKLGPLNVPPPQDWLGTEAVKSARPQLSDIVVNAIEQAGDATWVFKDPHSAYTLPLWTQIFNAAKITPAVVLCVRDPAAVITSLKRQYNFDALTAELFWLTKNLRAIIDTSADVFVVHYETLMRGDTGLVSDLIAFAHIADPAPAEKVAGFIEQKLNRSGTNTYTVQNPLVHALWEALQKCRGADFDRAGLMREALRIEAALTPWTGWLSEIHKLHARKGPVRDAAASETQAQHEELSPQVSRLQAERAQINERLADALRETQSGDEKLRLAAEEINRLRSFATALTAQVGSLEESRAALAEQMRELEAGRAKLQQAAEGVNRLRTYSSNLSKEQASRIEKFKKERDTLKDEVIRLNGSTTMRFGRFFRAFRKAPLRETFRLPKRIVRMRQAQRSKRKFGLS